MDGVDMEVTMMDDVFLETVFGPGSLIMLSICDIERRKILSIFVSR